MIETVVDAKFRLDIFAENHMVIKNSEINNF